MRKASLSVVYLGIIALLLAGCNPESNTNSNNAVTPSSPTPAVSPPPSPVAATPVPQPPTTVVASGLIQPTNPDERARQVQKGRTDPFAVFPAQPEVSVEAGKDVPQVPSLTGSNTTKAQNSNPQYFIAPCPGGSGLQCRYPVKPNSSGQVATNRPTTTKAATNRPKTTNTATNRPKTINTATNRPKTTNTATNRPKTPGQVAINRPPDTIPGLPPGGQTPGTNIPPGQLPGTPPTGLPPEVPTVQEPELAKRVEVTGVVEVGGRMYAIVKAPNETTSRYVQAGDTLADGQITVQRIEMNEGSAPMVILAQYGVEVTRSVGEKGDTPGGTPTQPSASIILEQPSAPPSASIDPEQPPASPSASINPEQPPTSGNIPQNGTVPPNASANTQPQI